MNGSTRDAWRRDVGGDRRNLESKGGTSTTASPNRPGEGLRLRELENNAKVGTTPLNVAIVVMRPAVLAPFIPSIRHHSVPGLGNPIVLPGSKEPC